MHRFVILMVFLGLVIACPVLTTTNGQESDTATPNTLPNISTATMESERLRVHVLELTRSISPSSDHGVTSVLFMVEHLGTDAINSTDIGSLNFSNQDGDRMAMPASECPKSGVTNYQYGRFSPPWHINMPEPADRNRTKIVRFWMCNEIPSKAATLDVQFGRNGKSEKFSFAFAGREGS